jgi:hypothetical protein
MKKYALLIIYLLVIIDIKAQINFEHSFNGIEQLDLGGYIYIPKDKFFILSSNNTISIYNSDYSLYKTVPYSPPSNYIIGAIGFSSKTLFNTDNKYEFVVFLNTSNYSSYMYQIINEDGTVIKNLGTYNIGRLMVIAKIDNSFKLCIYDFSNSYSNYDIYSLPGNPLKINYSVTYELSSPFPNPSQGLITLPYSIADGEKAELRILNIKGQVIKIVTIYGGKNEFTLDTRNYTPGIYMYSYKNITSRFIVK